MLKDKVIVLGVTGGIAAYKAADLASKLTQAGAIVKVVMTWEATELIKPLTFQALTGNALTPKCSNRRSFRPLIISHWPTRRISS